MNVFRRKDGLWCGKYKDMNTGKWRYVYRKDKQQAKDALRQAIRDMEDGYTPPSQKMTVAAMLDEWLDELRDNVSRRTFLNRESLVRVHIKPSIGSKQPDKITAKDIRELYRSKLASGLSSGTVKRLHIILNQSMRDAVKAKYIRSNPVADVKPPRQQSTEPDVLSPDNVRKLLVAARGNRYEGVFVLGATVGLRIGEALALRWDDVDINRGVLSIRRTLWRGKVYSSKTASSNRTLRLPHRALEALVRQREVHGGVGPLPNQHRLPY